MSSENGRTATPSFLVSGSLKPAQLASIEVAKEVWDLVGDENRENFLVVGGTALLLHGYPIMTCDTDIAITADTLYKFENLAMKDPRYAKSPFGQWTFESPRGFTVTIDFLDKTGEAGPLEKCTDYTMIDGIPVTTVEDLAIGKGAAWINRQLGKDFFGFKCAVKKMTETGLNFKQLSQKKREILDDIMFELEGMREEWGVLRVIRTLL
ncbi:hypothetical protein B9Z19DRAFT_1138312 [Tuber borchii]|uniref:Uncharacterized protein n=1 Tax=Tuber borchii TaxID=42251 RepID=A0A2T6Z9X4_TUBBO|nr:hypothetical protein B9Z19DRAFT_1138312 [Tuber borchii]